MRHDIHKLALWLEKVCQDGVATERKVLEWKIAEAETQSLASRDKLGLKRLLDP